jgi:hypothetical protein
VQLNSNGDKARNLAAAELYLAAQERIREQLPALANRRPRAYAWPQLLDSEPAWSERRNLSLRERKAGEVLGCFA